MPLQPRRHAPASARGGYRTLAGAMDADQGVQSEALGGKGVLQAIDLDAVFPPGFFCTPPPGAEQVVIPCAGGDVIVGWRLSIPADVAARAASRPAMWDDQGQRIELNGTTGARVLLAGRQRLKVHLGGAAKSVVLSNDPANVDSAFQLWLNGIVSAVNALAPGALTNWGGGHIAHVVSSCTTLEAE